MSRSLRLPHLTVGRAARLLKAELVTSEELCLYCHSLAVLGEEKWHLNAFTKITERDFLLEQARKSDIRRMDSPDTMSPLEGIPVTVKANLAVSTEALTAASQILGSTTPTLPPVGYNASVVDTLLHQCGAVLVGITNMDEFGMGSLGTNVAPSKLTNATITRNPRPFMHHLPYETVPISDDDERMAKLIRTPVEELEHSHELACLTDDGPMWSAGGSSCGSAVSVAHGSSLASLGTDTGGSVRLPAAWCGVVGLKPSYGLLSRHGVVSYASSLDTVGILAPSVSCATTVLDCLAQRSSNHHGSRDSTASYYAPSTKLSCLVENTPSPNTLDGLTIGIPAAFSVSECPPPIQEAWARGASVLEKNGATIKTISSESISPEIVQHSLSAYYVLASAEASSNLSRYDGLRYGVGADLSVKSDGSLEEEDANISEMTQLEKRYSATRASGFGKEVIRRILSGASVLSSDRFHTHYEAAAKLRALLTKQLNSALDDVDLLLIPSALSFPCIMDEESIDSTEMFANDVMTVPVSLAGLPAVSVPFFVNQHASQRESVAGLQVVGPRLGEEMVLKIAKLIEQESESI